MKVSAQVRIGINKENCDDSAIIGDKVINNESCCEEITAPVIIGVADGVGGNKGGKDASIFVMNALLQIKDFDSVESIRSSIININKELLEYSRSVSGKENMATTLTVLFIGIDHSYIAHIGNTRGYSVRGSYLKQFTKDHTTYQWLLSSGQYDIAEACNKNEINACLGGGTDDLVSRLVVEEIFTDGLPNTIVLTSDGVHEHIDIDDFEDSIAEEKTDEEIITKLIDLATDNGSTDDKTVIIVRS